MNRIFSLLGLMLCLFSSSYAQPVFNFSANPVDSFTTGHNWDTTQTMRSYIRNTTASPLVLNWQLITDSTDRPPGWLVAGICDNWFCRTPLGDSLETGHKVHTETIAPGDSSILELRAFVWRSMPDGVGVFKFKVYDAPQTQVDTLTFRLCKNMNCGDDGGIPTGIVPVGSEAMNVLLFPNPAGDKVTIEMKDGGKNAVLFLYDHTGRMLERYVPGANRQTIDMQGHPSGIYFVRLYGKDGRTVQRKIVKR